MDTRVAKAVSHPMRMRILTILNQRVASPSELAVELGEPLGQVSYHVKRLEKLRCVELVSSAQKRGAIQHFYRALERPALTEKDMASIPRPIRRGIADAILVQVAKDLRAAAKGGGLDRDGVRVADTELTVDAKGWADIKKALLELTQDALAIQASSVGRVTKRRAEDDSQNPDTFSANLALMFLENTGSRRTPPPHRRR